MLKIDGGVTERHENTSAVSISPRLVPHSEILTVSTFIVLARQR